MDDAVAAARVFLAGGGELLGKWRAVSQCRSLPVNDVHRNDKNEGDAEKDGRGVFQVLSTRGSDVAEEGNGGDGQNTSQEVTL